MNFNLLCFLYSRLKSLSFSKEIKCLEIKIKYKYYYLLTFDIKHIIYVYNYYLMRNLIGRYMHRGREKAVANTPHFPIIFTVFYFVQKNVDTRRKTLRLLLPLPPPTRPSPTHPLPKTLTHPLTHPPFAQDPHQPTLCPRPSPTHPLPKVLLLVLYFICLQHYLHTRTESLTPGASGYCGIK